MTQRSGLLQLYITFLCSEVLPRIFSRSVEPIMNLGVGRGLERYTSCSDVNSLQERRQKMQALNEFSRRSSCVWNSRTLNVNSDALH